MEKLGNFIFHERQRFVTEHSNSFAFCFAQIIRYLGFLRIILDRYDRKAKEFDGLIQTISQIPKEPRELFNKRMDEVMSEVQRLTETLHLEIESFYLFAKILLDKIARSVEYYFGSARKLPLDSHDDLAKNFDGYIRSKNLNNLTAGTKNLILELKKDIADFRDYQIAHEKSPRIIQGTQYNSEDGVVMSVGRILPRKNETMQSSKNLHHLNSLLNKYINDLIVFIENNREYTNLKISKEARDGSEFGDAH